MSSDSSTDRAARADRLGTAGCRNERERRADRTGTRRRPSDPAGAGRPLAGRFVLASVVAMALAAGVLSDDAVAVGRDLAMRTSDEAAGTRSHEAADPRSCEAARTRFREAARARAGEAARGRLDGQQLVATLGRARIDASAARQGAGATAEHARCDVAIRSLAYTTVAPDGAPTVASGVLLVPGGADCPGPYPIVAYAKGTDINRHRRLASADDGETRLLVSMLAAHGYLVVASDYLGFGRSTLPYHPYLHAASQASSIVDAIRAARSALAALGIVDSGRLFLTGYSQGGHAALATQRALERGTTGDLTVSASGPMAGPYDLSGTFVAGADRLPQGSPGSTVFLPYLVTSYQQVYGNLYESPHEYFREPYASGIENLLPGDLSVGRMLDTNRLPHSLGELITPALLRDLLDPASPLRRALEENTLLDWKPRAPVLLCGGSRDPVVPFENSVRAAAALSSRGGNVRLVDVEQVPAHWPALPPPDAPPSDLTRYHGALLPPLCLTTIRNELFAPLR